MRTIDRRDALKLAATGTIAAMTRPSRSQGERDMVEIPAATVILGTPPEMAARLAERYACHPSWLAGEAPREARLATYRIDRYPVTRERYAEFLRATGHAPPMGWGGPDAPAGPANHPVTGVSYVDATAYAAWAGLRLPTEDEWEYAARGAEGLVWPWGNQFDPDACTWNATGTTPVDAHPEGASPFGLLDMAGNAAEWCADQPSASCAVMKGGSWINATPLTLRGACRIMTGWATNQANFFGFRCAR